MDQVIIDGIEYVPKTSIVTAASLMRLSEAYSIAYGWGYYDPCCQYGIKQFQEIYDLLREVNKELKFRL